ncbi:hypothetical protein [Clostridium sp. DJ247]|uniref:hypothetical protein n=1 Tax=Clostridium sp. DJ247 TaxID=2726188 RepID=UPI00162A53D1|nr:hypothetical protein [Clostridium sp. DJ247]MBC2580124.1 hypothetical protein [Clostridium sp. DJ247]
MASINFELCELVDIIKNSVKMPEQIRKIGCEDDSIKVTIDPGKLVPSFNVILTYDRFDKGKIMFSVKSKGPVRLIMSILNTTGVNINKSIWEINANHFSLDINDYLRSKFNFVEVKDIIIKDDKFSIIL